MTRNRYKVPEKQWKRWSERARRVFNYVFETMQSQRMFLYPDLPTVPAKKWKTTRWNAAWTAADAVNVDAGKKAKCLVADLYPDLSSGHALNNVDPMARRREVEKALREAWSRGYAARMDQEP